MSRPLRIDYPGAWFHVMNRGAGKRTTFTSDLDRHMFLSLLGEIYHRFGVEIHAYCLMTNHYHLLLRTPEATLSRSMRHLGGTYTQNFNRVHGTDGPLFRGRFKSILVDSERYLATLSSYIHLNPVVAGMAEEAVQYRWSSAQAILGLRPVPDWLFVDRTLGAAGSKAQYAAMLGGSAPDPELVEFYGRDRVAPVLGDRVFRAEALERAASDPETRSARVRCQTPPSLAEIESVVAAELGVPIESLYSATRRQDNIGRLLAVGVGRTLGRSTLTELATRYDFSGYSGASSAVQRLARLCETDALMSHRLTCIVRRVQELKPR